MAPFLVTTVWWLLGFAMTLVLAVRREIPAERSEAARLDGARLRPIIHFITPAASSRNPTLVVVKQIILHFQAFGQSHLIIRAGLNDASQGRVRTTPNATWSPHRPRRPIRSHDGPRFEGRAPDTRTGRPT